MREVNDWRLTNQLTYFRGATLEWKDYRPTDSTWEHDHCEFCWAKFMAEEGPELSRSGYATPDNLRWVCNSCFEDFKDLFEWKVAGQ